MNRTIVIIVICIVCIAAGFVYLMIRLQAEPEAQAELPIGMIEVNGRTVIVELALTASSQTRGLSYRESLDPERGMLFIYDAPRTQRFWMNQMRFPIDMVFINGDTVIQVESNVPAPNGGMPAVVTSKSKADKVLEINAGKAKEWGIEEGSAVRVLE